MVDKILPGLIVAWLTWVSNTLIKFGDRITRLEDGKPRIALVQPSPNPEKKAPSLAVPLLPIPNLVGSFLKLKESKDANK